jgi:hypothetical protein
VQGANIPTPLLPRNPNPGVQASDGPFPSMAPPLPPVYNPLMRPLILTLFALAALSALAAEPTAYPLWDGQETIAES